MIDAEDRWLDSTSAMPPDQADSPVLTEDQVQSWREQGHALVDGVVPAVLVARLRDEAAAFFPDAGDDAAAAITDFGSFGRFVFPSNSDVHNAVTLHPRLLSAVAQLLGVAVVDVRLTQSDLWAKYGRSPGDGDKYDNADQRIHVDYPNHTLTHPPVWDAPEAVEMVLYLDDVDIAGGATAVVPRSGAEDPAYRWPITGTPGVGDFEWINDRAMAEATIRERDPALADWRQEALYDRELRTRYRIGSLLTYRHDTWHRGTPIAAGARRLAMNLTFRRAQAEWISTLHHGWAWAMYRRSEVMERLISSASVEQRCVLGFPAPGHEYWTPETVAAVGARYRRFGMDMSPYV